MKLQRKLGWLFAILIFPAVLAAQSDDLLTRILNGVQQTQAKYTSSCGSVTETRTSKLIVKPMVFHGKFCAAGSDRFMLEYGEPNPMRIRFNGNTLNITTDGKTEAMDVGGDVRRAQSKFGGGNLMKELKKNFDVTAKEDSRDFELRLVPRSQGMRHRLNYLVVKLNKVDYTARSLTVDGKSGVHSEYVFEITATNTKLPEDTFEVIKPQ